MEWIYLDNNATTQPAPEVVQAVQEINQQLWANPSSVHRFGQAVRHRVELARSSLARLIGCQERELIFTSGGTEANNLALGGVLDWASSPRAGPGPGSGSGPALLITTPIEHAAIRQPADHLAKKGVSVVQLPVDRGGWVKPDDLAGALDAAQHDGHPVILVSIHWANNETGAIEPIEDLACVVQQHRQKMIQEPARGRRASNRLLFHVDAVQAVGKIPIDLSQVPVDLLSLSAHKFHGPKGTGALFVRDPVRIRPQLWGGSQEQARRGGTQNTPGIIAMGVAADLAREFLADPPVVARQRDLRDRFERSILEALPGTVVHSAAVGPDSDDTHLAPGSRRLWNTSNLGFMRLEAEAILLGLSERGVCASAGAACSSGSLEPSPVLLAMGIDEPVAHGSVRFSLSRFTDPLEIRQAVTHVVDVVKRLTRVLPV